MNLSEKLAAADGDPSQPATEEPPSPPLQPTSR